jgi:hypothetical protein
MRNKILVIVICATALFTKVSAQVCEPELKSTGLIYPDTVLFPCIEKNVPFDEPIHLFPPETYQIATVDSIVLTGILGLPTGINYACNPAGCVFPGGQHGCISLNGTATDTVGHYHLILQGLAYLTTSTTGQFTLPLEQMTNFLGAPPSTYGVDLINPGDGCRVVTDVQTIASEVSLTVSSISSIGEIAYSINSNDNNTGEIQLIAMDGRIIYSEKIVCNGKFTGIIRKGGLPSGIYALSYNTLNKNVSKKLTIQ